MKTVNKFAKVVDKTIPTNLDPYYDPNSKEIKKLKTVYDEELKIKTMKDVYHDDRVRVIVKTKDNSSYLICTYAYMVDNGWGASEVQISSDELNDLGLVGAIKEAVIGEKGLFDCRGSSVCTGDMPA